MLALSNLWVYMEDNLFFIRLVIILSSIEGAIYGGYIVFTREFKFRSGDMAPEWIAVIIGGCFSILSCMLLYYMIKDFIKRVLLKFNTANSIKK